MSISKREVMRRLSDLTEDLKNNRFTDDDTPKREPKAGEVWIFPTRSNDDYRFIARCNNKLLAIDLSGVVLNGDVSASVPDMYKFVAPSLEAYCEMQRKEKSNEKTSHSTYNASLT